MNLIKCIVKYAGFKIQFLWSVGSIPTSSTKGFNSNVRAFFYSQVQQLKSFLLTY